MLVTEGRRDPDRGGSDPPQNNRRVWLLGMGGVLVALVAICGLTWWLIESDDSAGPERGVTLEQVVDQPERFVGQQVVVSGSIAEMNLRPRAFGLGGELGELALVIPQEGTGWDHTVTAEDDVRVTGTVRIFHRADWRDELNMGGDDVFLDPFEGQAMIYASKVELLDQDGEGPLPPDEPVD